MRTFQRGVLTLVSVCLPSVETGVWRPDSRAEGEARRERADGLGAGGSGHAYELILINDSALLRSLSGLLSASLSLYIAATLVALHLVPLAEIRLRRSCYELRRAGRCAHADALAHQPAS